MPQTPITLIKGDKIKGVTTDYGDSLLTNMYAVKKDILGAAGYILSYPGLTQLGTGTGIDRGGIYNERFDDQYRISGTSLISVAADGTVVNLSGTGEGAVEITGTEQVAMPYSFNTQCIIADGKMFLYDPVGGLVEVTDADLGDPIDCVWINGYYFLTDGEYLYHTDIADETSIDPLNYGTAEFMPDGTKGLSKTQDNKVAVWGRYSLEYFIDAAAAEFAFTRVENRAQKIGIVATHAKCESGGKFYIVGGRKDESISVHIVTVGDSVKISTREIDKIISQYTEPELSDIRMECRTENDVTFILIHLPSETLCFNETVAGNLGKEVAWSILKSDVLGDTEYRAINGILDPRSSKWIYGDKTDTTIGYLDNTVSTQYDEIVESLFYSPFIKLETLSIDELEIETIPGHTDYSDAKVSFSITLDGITYGLEWFKMYGLPLDYGHRFILRRLGYIGNWCGFKFRTACKSRMAFGLMKVTYS